MVLASILAVSLFLTACSGGASKDVATGSTNAGEGGSSASAKTALKSVTLKMVVPGVPQKDQAAVTQAINEYLKDDLNITLDLEVVDWSSWDQRNNLIISSGENVDLLFSAAWSGFNTNVAKGAFLPLDDLVKEYGQDILKSNYNWILDAAKFNGKLYAIPTYQELAQARGIYVRQDLVDKYGPEVNFQMKDINNLEDLEPMLKVIKEKEPNMTPLYLPPNYYLNFTGSWDRDGDFDPAAIDVNKGEMKFVNFFESDYYKKTMELSRRWFQQGYVNKDAAVTKENGAEKSFGANKAFSYVSITNVGMDKKVSQRNGDIPVGMFQVNKPFITTGLVQGALFVIPRQSKNEERAMMFINRLHTDKKLVNMLVYGIEGKHYVKKSDNVIDIAPGIDPTSNPYLSNTYWMFGNQSLLYTYGNADPNGPKLLDDFNQIAVKSPAFGFTYDPAKMKNEIAAISNIVAEYNPGLSTGAIDYADGQYDKFLKKLKAAGVDKLIADKQAQLDEWIKQNNK